MSVCHKIRPHIDPKLLVKADTNEKGLNCVRCDHSNRAGDRETLCLSTSRPQLPQNHCAVSRS